MTELERRVARRLLESFVTLAQAAAFVAAIAFILRSAAP